MEVDGILKSFVDECGKKLNLKCIIQFGSSTYDKNPEDIDLLFFFNDLVMSYEDSLSLFKIMKDYERKHTNVSFDFSGVSKKKNKLNITIIPLQGVDIKWKVDVLFTKSLVDDPRKKVLYGENPLPKKLEIDKNRLVDRFTLDLNHYYRYILDEGDRSEVIYEYFKIFLRMMLINDGNFEKSELIDEFKKKYEDKIRLPKNSRGILNKKFLKEDYLDVLKFGKDYLGFLAK